ncbi:50S ribosomal protein L32e [Candidatus Woesearchaeota archaeon]|nr:50S ribosomal protein L32e [Candidatus Woesearchaeota archaeon]
MADMKKLLEMKNTMAKKRPRFIRQDSHKKKRLAPVWRKPKGMDSKLRKHMHGHGHLPVTGYRGPALVRGTHKSGLIPLLIHTVTQLESVNPKTHGVIIASTVGARKAIDIITKAQSKNVRILNYKDPAKFVTGIKDGLAKRKQKKSAAPKQEMKPKTEAKPVKQEPQKMAPVTQEKKEAERREAEKVLTSKQ